MSRFTKIGLVGLALVLLVASLGAQSLTDSNPHTLRARQLRIEADAAMDAGDYARAIELAGEVEREQELAVVWAEQQYWAYRSNGMRRLANEQLARVRSFAPTEYPDQYKTATDAFASGETAFSAEQYEQSWNHFRTTRETLMGLFRASASAGSSELPEYYVVRKLVGKSDSFWRIASYDFVYGDGRLWPKLYEANKQILRDPSNPHLIHPGMRFVIPSIDGEKRSGEWQPE